MKLNISGPDMTKEDLTNVCKFFADYWKDRKDIISVIVTEGIHDCTKEELMKIMENVFEGRPYHTKIIDMPKTSPLFEFLKLAPTLEAFENLFRQRGVKKMKCSKCEKKIGKDGKFQLVQEGVLEEKEQSANKDSDEKVKTLAMGKTVTKFYCEEHKLK